ncbi:MAG: T9SS type A sorting domain-containing protein, partial [Bacteroidetes bacterium]|nr:T9SS type A sorting domain-containing protein [Bacteroidota bacterium]
VCGNEYWQTASGITSLTSFSVGSCGVTGLDYRSIANGDWTNLNTWEVYDPGTASWYPAAGSFDNCGSVSYPTSQSRTVEVRHKVRFNYTIPIGVDQVTISAAGHLWIPEGITMMLDTTGAGANFVVGANGSNGIDLHNYGRLEITGSFIRRYTATTPLFTNVDASIVNYNGADQNIWHTSYSHLWLDDSSSAPRANAQTVKSLTGHLTEVRHGLWFRNAKMQLGNYDCRLLHTCVVKTPGQNTGYMIATQNGYCRWEFVTGNGIVHHYPIGGVLYSPAVVTFDNITIAGWLRGRVREQQHPLAPNPIHRYWTMDTTGSAIRYTGGSNASGYFGYAAQFFYNHADLQEPWTTLERQYQLVEEGRAYSLKYVEDGNWRLSTRQEVPYDPRVQFNEGVITNSAFSDFTFNPIEDVVLPVENLVLRGMWRDRDAQLLWTTSREQNSFMFTLERAIDGEHFSPVTMRPAAGYSPVMQQYPYLDAEVADMDNPRFYYRVMQEDLDGKVAFSNVVMLERDDVARAPERVRVYPNPVRSSQELLVDYTLPAPGKVRIEMIDMLGRRLAHYDLTSDTGLHTHTLPTKGLAVGTYLVVVTTPQRTYNTKVLVFN